MKRLGDQELDRLAMHAQTGDSGAFTDLIHATHLPLRCFIATIASSTDMIEEVVQSTYVTAFQQIATYQPRGTFLAWLKGVARNLVRRELRERQRCQHIEPDALEIIMVDDGLAIADAEGAAVEARDRALVGLDRCLERLTPTARALISRSYADGLSLNQLAQHFHKRRSAIAMTLSRIRTALRTCLERQGVVG